MKAAAILIALALPAFGQQPPAGHPKNSCLECHGQLDGNQRRPAELFEQDIHRKHGFSCVDCHGGDPSSDDMQISMSPRRGFLGKIGRRQTPELCARCHSDPKLIHAFKPQQRVDQLVQYRTSVHGKRLAAGDLRVANCIDCHSVHEIREVKDSLSPVHPLRLPETCARCHASAEHMKAYQIPTQQFDHYRRSAHWEALAKRGDLSAPTCATCHGNHSAAPPGVTTVSNVCGACHVVFQDLFDRSPHKAAFDAAGLAACVVCHGNHEVARATPQMLGTSAEAVCTQCHSQGDAGHAAAAAMRARLDELRGAVASAEQILNRAEQSGMEISEGRLQLTSAHEAWIKARVQVHSFRSDDVDSVVREGWALARKSHRTGVDALRERDYRRKGLAFSLVSIAVTILGLWLTIRSRERRPSPSP